MALNISIVFSNNKGGVAKTATCTALACIANKDKKKVLVVDMDMQANTSFLLGYQNGDELKNLATYFAQAVKSISRDDENLFPKVSDYILPTEYKNVDIMLGDIDLQGPLEQYVKDASISYGNLVEIMLDDIKSLDKYDYVYIDTSPSMSIFVTGAISAADWTVIPTDVDRCGIDGAFKIAAFIRQRAKRFKSSKIAGVLFTRTDDRTAISKSIPSFKNSFEKSGIPCLEVNIPNNVDVPNSRMIGKPVTDQYPDCKASKKYVQLYKELEKMINDGEKD